MTKPLHLSPSLHHQHLMKQIKPVFAYAGGDLKPWQNRLRRKLRELMGYGNELRVPLHVRSLWKREHPLGMIEKIVFTSEPYSDVTAYVCLPKEAKPPYDLFICLQGHTTGMHNSIAVERDDETKTMVVPNDRDFAIGCMKRGIAALCIEQRSFGDRRELLQAHGEEHNCQVATMHAIALGRTIAGERVYDVDRGIDYLQQRGDINMKTLGVMGNSGGGTISLFAAALLPRIQFAMPSCYFCTFRDSIMSIYHCEDNYIPGIMHLAEMSDIMGLFAPKPVVLVAGKDDPIFPVKAVRKAFADLKKIYRAAGAEHNCKLVIGNGGHRFYADDAWPAMQRLVQA